MSTVTLAANAMATRFELILHGDSETQLRAAGEEALAEIQRIENQLSLYRPTSEIAQINSRAAREKVQASPEVFALLQHAIALGHETEGAFDVTIAPLVRCWGFMNASGKLATPEAIALARTCVGMDKVQLDPATRQVRFAGEGVMIDLGAIGKGYAVERATELLRAAEIQSALLHGGTSTVSAIGGPPDAPTWKVALPERCPSPVQTDQPITFELRDEALSVSAIWGRAFRDGEKTYGHVIDPRSGLPVTHSVLSTVVLPTATDTDALSTALLILGKAAHKSIHSLRSGMRSLLVESNGNVQQQP